MSSTGQRRRNTTPFRKTWGEQVRDLLFGPVGAIALVGVIGVGIYIRQQRTATEFVDQVAIGQETLAEHEQTFPDLGQEHVAPGEPVNYDLEFPVSGPHDPVPVLPGVYDTEQRPEMLVHSLEHGNIVIYYDQPEPAVMQTLTQWAEQFPGAWDGVVVVPKAGLGQEVVLTAWTKKVRMAEFDVAVAAAFVDTYRGRGPENPVR